MSAAARIIPAGGGDDFPAHTVARVAEAAMGVELAPPTDRVAAGDWAPPPAPAAG